ncbi:MAG: hypothetical protein DCC75_05915 [Proteobacteria bacterium]|nr:MAG: hypothetical protein DCC75_05915 [Pseudomonadota bacterium]
MQVKDKYDEVFQIEMEGWAYGLANYPGEIFPELVFRVLRELEPSFIAAIEHHYAFNILEVSSNFSRSAKYLVHEMDIAFYILTLFPHPSRFKEEGQFTMASVIDQVEKAYGGALERMEKKWKWDAAYESELSKDPDLKVAHETMLAAAKKEAEDIVKKAP